MWKEDSEAFHGGPRVLKPTYLNWNSSQGIYVRNGEGGSRNEGGSADKAIYNRVCVGPLVDDVASPRIYEVILYSWKQGSTEEKRLSPSWFPFSSWAEKKPEVILYSRIY